MQRINVVGISASGKSTFARSLANKLGLAYIELDDLFWLDNWEQSQDQDFFQKIQQAIDHAPQGYVIDGNYTRTIPIKWANIDTIIWLDYPFYVNFKRSIQRAIHRAWTQHKLWPSSNNRENLTKLFGQDSIIWWMVKTHRKNRQHYLKLMHAPEYQHIQWLRIRKPKQLTLLMNMFKAQSNSQSHRSQ
ncbi:adenylate kinase [Acinetobacter sp. NCu2D-2]|uniref:adenylate kinase n=1 Tax=Acinetobacter sp. NCu2D-2 TaxID=1608473 RepID=UPI0007CDD0F5|nr:adenylate kinase [Acinetobacter sp. NCu2D-2]ANF82466.1 adenylate kinase [Acinetobacter sp. NCu2D-2]